MSRIKRMIPSTFIVLILSILLSVASAASAGGGETVHVTYTGQAVDTITFNGVSVDAKYSLGGGYGSSEYSCAALIMRFYKEVYGFDVWNLSSSAATPTCSNGESFTKTDTPRVGDIVRFQDRTHWALVKEVEGDTVTLIEQNWGYYSGGGYVAAVNRIVTVGDAQVSFFTYSAYGTSAEEDSKYETWEDLIRAEFHYEADKLSFESEDNLKVVATNNAIQSALSNNFI